MRRGLRRAGAPRRVARLGPGLLVLALALGVAGPSRSQTPDSIFRQVFGRPAPTAARALDLPVLALGHEIGTVPARIGAEAAVDAMRLADLLADRLQPELSEALRAGAGDDGYAAVERLARASGLDIAYDSAGLTLRVDPKPEQRRAMVIDFAAAPRLPEAPLRPAWISAYSNLRLGIGWDDLAGERIGEGRQPLRAAFDNAINIDGWVVEGQAFFQEDGVRRWRRGDLRVVGDFTARGVRFTAGDVTYPLAAFQSGRPIGGLAVARNFLLQPYRSFQPAGQHDFVLRDPATVEVQVNGRPTRTFRLPPGPYSLTNFPGTSGTNDVRIRITDAFGREQVVEIPFFFDRQLLAPGVHEFAYAAGLPSRIVRDAYEYDAGLAMLSGLHRLGITDRLTLGLNIQADRRQWVIGGELLLATPFGTFGVEPAFSRPKEGAGDWAVALRYRDYRNGSEFWRRRTVSAQAVWRGADFAPLGATPRNPVSLDLSARIGQPVARNLTLSLGGRYQESRTVERSDTYSLDLDARSRLFTGVDLDVGVERLRHDHGRDETVAYAALRILLGDGRQSLATGYDSATERRRLEWRYHDIQPVDSLSASVQAARDRNGDSLAGDLAYVHPRFNVLFRHDLGESLPADTHDPGIDRRSTLTFGTALAFADGHVALSRPIADSFAIVAAHPSLDGRRIGVDPFGHHHLARSDALGPAVVPNLAPYRLRPLLLDVPELPVDYHLGEDRPVLMPSYRSGTVVPIGTDPTASLSGILNGPDGRPLGLLAGRLVPAGGGGPEILFFTNRAGRFRIDGVRPGSWRLLLSGHEDRPVPLTVKAGSIDLGVLTP